MTDYSQEAWVQLATRIPKTLHRHLKLHCVQSDTSLMDPINDEKVCRNPISAKSAADVFAWVFEAKK